MVPMILTGVLIDVALSVALSYDDCGSLRQNWVWKGLCLILELTNFPFTVQLTRTNDKWSIRSLRAVESSALTTLPLHLKNVVPTKLVTYNDWAIIESLTAIFSTNVVVVYIGSYFVTIEDKSEILTSSIWLRSMRTKLYQIKNFSSRWAQ